MKTEWKLLRSLHEIFVLFFYILLMVVHAGGMTWYCSKVSRHLTHTIFFAPRLPQERLLFCCTTKLKEAIMSTGFTPLTTRLILYIIHNQIQALTLSKRNTVDCNPDPQSWGTIYMMIFTWGFYLFTIQTIRCISDLLSPFPYIHNL